MANKGHHPLFAIQMAMAGEFNLGGNSLLLYINNLVANVPGWFREEFPSALNDIFELAEKSVF
jgi:hypothetical protein